MLSYQLAGSVLTHASRRTRSMPNSDKAVTPGLVGGAEKYRIVAQLLREQAARSEMPPEQAAKANSLADYFDALADDPTCKVPIER